MIVDNYLALAYGPRQRSNAQWKCLETRERFLFVCLRHNFT